MRHLLFLLLPLLLAFGGCAKTGEPTSPTGTDPLLTAAIATQGATLAALSARDQAAAAGDQALCLGASGLVAALPVASTALLDLHADGALDEIPGVSWDGGMCLGEVQADLDPTAVEARVAEYVTAALGTVRLIVESHGQGEVCAPLQAALAYAEPVPGQVVALLQGATSASLPAVPITPCSAG